MNSYALAFGILGTGIVVAVVLWSIPHLKRRRQVRRFRSQLDQVDLVTLAWRESLRDTDPNDDVPILPEPRRGRRARRHDPDKGGDALV